MPMYTLFCPACGHEFERFLRPSEALEGAPCPACGLPAREQTADAPTASPPPACGPSKTT